MSKTREKKPVMSVKTINEAETVMAEYATADAKLAKINATMDEQMTAIRNKFTDQINELTEVKEEKLNLLHFFAESNTQLFDKKKSILMTHGAIGFRTGTPKLKTLKRFTWGSVVELLKIKLPEYVRTVDEPAKDKLLADRDDENVSKHFEKCGIEVVQDETFYVELKKEAE
ncbi:host-nuclease inhibitor Gam family protein [Aurantibacillus circumpalustris]|uniref:host-nuclease inhibitor Gam family protein n=1 Tax=Aurantibacillus circumpalustris TaxID=3036359 RepID=UPI00295B74C6|nr:host-nuclease inhibitor Gam family protein [Aurantibacillus circumpalustris]